MVFPLFLEQLLSHPFITKHEKESVDLAAFVQSIFDPTQRLKDIADVSTMVCLVNKTAKLNLKTLMILMGLCSDAHHTLLLPLRWI